MNKKLSFLTSVLLSGATSCVFAEDQSMNKPESGFYAGFAAGFTRMAGDRSDVHVSQVGPTTFQLSKDKGMRDTSERAEIILGYFHPFEDECVALSVEGFYGFSHLRHKVRSDLGVLAPVAGAFLEEILETSRTYGANVRFGPYIEGNENDYHFVSAILGFEGTRVTRNHEDGIGREFHKTSRNTIGFQYGLSYQYLWGRSSIGIEAKQTIFPSKRLSKADSTGAVTTTNYKLNLNSVMLRYTYKIY